MIRATTLLLVGLAGGLALSQGPAFVQQYKQNLDGELRALAQRVDSLERDAQAVGLTVDEALTELSGASRFAQRRVADERVAVARYRKLAAHRDALHAAGPMLGVPTLIRSYDRTVADAALSEFKPSAELTVEGGAHAAAGFVLARVVAVALLGGLGLLFGFGRRRAST